jgi:hypothetical protein
MRQIRTLTELRLARHLPTGARTLPSREPDSPETAGGARGESGAVLILALVFLIVVGGIVGVLANSVSSHLEDSTAFSAGRSLQYAATSAVDLAIQNIRYTPLITPGETLDASPPAQCWNTAIVANDGASQWGGVNGEPLIDLWCSTVWNPNSGSTRTVTISACEDSVNGSAATCAVSPLLQAVVVFGDYPPGVSAPSTGICSVYCGSGETIESWSWSPTIPTVSNLATPSNGLSGGPIVGQTPVVLTGTGFVSGATTVNFIQESGGVPTLTAALAPVTPTSITGTTIQTLTVPAPAVTAGTTFWVTVTTPTGTSAACPPSGTPSGPCVLYTYTTNTALSLPTVSSISVAHFTPAEGSTNGGDLITVNGSGFYGAPQVNFIPEGAGTTVSATDVLVATGGASLTAVTPGVIAGVYYLVQVVTTAGSSSILNVALVQYKYDQPVPVVSGVGLNATTTSTSYVAATGPLAIVGASFFTGAQVQFQPVQSGSCPGSYGNVTDTSVTVNSPSLITDSTLPSGLSSNCTYVVAVSTTTPAVWSSNAIDFKL